jgi:tryptophan synthase alpha chain
MMKRIRARTSVPVGVGFGIRDGATAAKIGRVADAVVIGSRIVQDMADAPEGEAPERARQVIGEFARALGQARVPA